MWVALWREKEGGGRERERAQEWKVKLGSNGSDEVGPSQEHPEVARPFKRQHPGIALQDSVHARLR